MRPEVEKGAMFLLKNIKVVTQNGGSLKIEEKGGLRNCRDPTVHATGGINTQKKLRSGTNLILS